MVSGRGDTRGRAFAWLFWLLVGGAILTLVPLWLPLVLAAWLAALLWRPVGWIERALRGRRRVAVTLTLLALVALLVPLSGALVSVVVAGSDFVRGLLRSPRWQAALQSLVSEDNGQISASDVFSPGRIVDLVRQHGAGAWSVLRVFVGATAAAVAKVFVFFVAAYAFLHEGDRHWRWLVDHAPIDRRHLARLSAAFHETGRGLVIGHGLTGLVQGTIAGIAFAVIGVPRAFLLGSLTFVASFIPSIGTGLVWVPVSAGLLLTDQTGRGIAVALVGVLLISTIDNVLRPIFARWGSLDLPLFMLILAVFGGFFVFGPWGFLLGPLVVRLAREALEIARDERESAALDG